MKISFWTIPIIMMLLTCGCQPEGKKQNPFPTRENFAWDTASFHVGMAKSDALTQLKDAVPLEEFDPKSNATIIRPEKAQLASDSWMLIFVSLQPIGPQCIARFTFADGVLAKLEIISESECLREASAYPTRQELSWGETKLRVGMNKDQIPVQIRQKAVRSDTAGVLVPDEKETASDVWLIRLSSDPAVGSFMVIRLTFKDQILNRIQIVSMAQ